MNKHSRERVHYILKREEGVDMLRTILMVIGAIVVIGAILSML